jgi:hypothetical protein
LTKSNKGTVTESIVHVIEEAQGNFNTNSLRRNSMLWLAKCVSVGANYGFSWLIVTRRPSEVSTQIFEHTSVKCVAQCNQPNSIRKLKTILSWQDVETIKTLDVGEFLVLTPKGVHSLKTSVYSNLDAEQITLVEPQKPKGFWQKFKEGIGIQPQC